MPLHHAIVTVVDEGHTGRADGIIYRCTLCPGPDRWAWRITHMNDVPAAIAEAHAHLAEEHNVDETPPPADPFTAIVMAAASMHEMYVSLIAAGFTEPQAVYLVGQALTGGKGTPPA